MMTTIKARSYEELETWLRRYKQGRIEILIVLSKAGLGKTEAISEVLKDAEYGYINAHTTPLSMFEKGYRYRNKLMVIDDIDTVLNNNDLVSLFKQFAETREIKHIEWNSTSMKLEGMDLPQSYDTSSKILLVGNRIKKVASLIDRGFCVVFEPTRQEILNRIEQIAEEQKIERKKRSEVIGLLKTLKGNLTLRTYKKALSLYGEKGWEECIAKSMQVSDKTIICERIVKEFPSEKWIEAWKFFAHERGDEWSRTNFYYHMKQLKSSDDEPNFDIEKTIQNFKQSVQVSRGSQNHGLDIGHLVKMQNLKALSQFEGVKVSNKSRK